MVRENGSSRARAHMGVALRYQRIGRHHVPSAGNGRRDVPVLASVRALAAPP
jgi:hypothetical protein